MHRSKDILKRMEEMFLQTQRLYLASLMRVEALGDAGALAGVSEREAAEVDHELNPRLLKAYIDRLGYVPNGLAKRSEIQREMATQTAILSERLRLRPGRSARAPARAEVLARSA